jgi:AcrR family transcriptional regulator
MAAPQPITQRRSRECELVQATRSLFDERGLQDAPIEEIARTVGIARGLIYRSFSSKEELYVLTVTNYLKELDGVLAAAIAPDDGAPARLEQWGRAYAGFCDRYPAFLDCALSLMRRPASELKQTISESVWLRLGQGMAVCINHVADIVAQGIREGSMTVEDADYTANVLWTQVLGTMHLARLHVGLRQAAPGIPALFSVSSERVVESCIASALATVGIARAPAPATTESKAIGQPPTSPAKTRQRR